MTRLAGPTAAAGLAAVLFSICPAPARAEDTKGTALAAADALVGLAREGFRCSPRTIKAKRAEALAAGADEKALARITGLALLVAGERRDALPLLEAAPELTTWAAMAEVADPGGLARARGRLAERARAKDAEAETLFLAALAFAGEGQPNEADALLARAVAKAGAALSPAFAPDPAVALCEEVEKEAKRLAPEHDVTLGLAELLATYGRNAAALRSYKRLDSPEARAASVPIEVELDPKRALRRVETLLSEKPGDPALSVTRAKLLWASGDEAGAKSVVQSLPSVPEGARKDLERVKAELALAAGDKKGVVELAEEALRYDQSGPVLGLVIRARVLGGDIERARAEAEHLFSLKPDDVDPFALLATVHEAAGENKKAELERLRSQPFSQELSRKARARASRSEVLSAVGDADRGVSAVGLEALRGRSVQLALPIDLALAKSTKKGTARTARDRVLAACKGQLKSFLEHRGPWDRFTLELRLYEKPKSISLSLPDADPARCTPPSKKMPDLSFEGCPR